MSEQPPSGSGLRKAADPGRVLIAISILLPAILFGLAAWQNRTDVLREAAARAERTVGVLHEHALKVFETHRLVIDRVNERLRAIEWSGAGENLELHELLKGIQEDLDQIATITVTDAEGRMRASSRTFPADPQLNFADRDWFQAVKAKPMERLYVSRSYTGRQSGQSVFNVADRVFDPAGGFRGAIAISVDRPYFEKFYQTVEPMLDHSVILLRADGTILARTPKTDVAVLSATSPLMQGARTGNRGLIETASTIDGATRIFGYRKVEPYPVFVGFGIGTDAALGVWRRNLTGFGLVALLSSFALLAVSGLAIRQTNRQRRVTHQWRDALQQVRAQAADRERVEEQLRQSQKMDAMGRLTGGVAHDFNNFLTVVIGSLDLLRRRMPTADDRIVRLVDNAIEGANRAATLTHRLLAFSRQQPLAPENVDANKLVSGMSELLRRTLGERVAVETVLAGGLWRSFADTNQLESALLNLAVNARDAMPEGGKLTIETANAHLDEVYATMHGDIAPGQYVVVCVSDTGAGMPPDVTARAFEPFFTTKPVGKGTGLGLSQVYGFAKQSGGHVAIYSEIDRGTTVKIYLPRRRPGADETEVEPEAVAAVPAASRRGETILVVEDESLVRAFSAAALRDAGYRVLEAEDGPGGLAILEAHPDICLLFTDVVLTGPLDGRKLADAALALRPNLKVVFTTGYTRNAIIHHGRLDDDVNFVGKPFTASALTAKIASVLYASAPLESA